MRLISVYPFYYLKENIFGEPPVEGHEIEYVITYLSDDGERMEYRTPRFQEMITFLKMIYEGEDFNDVIADPRDDDFFREYMKGNLIPFNETP